MSDPFQRAIEIFAELCDLPPEEQAQRLAVIEGDDPALHGELVEILEGDRAPDERLERKAEDFVSWQTVLLEAREGPVPEDVLESLAERGRALAHYRREGEVGRGGMGAVYQVWDEDLERKLAMKVLDEGGAAPSSVGRRRMQRFLDEARVTSQLDHPGVVPVHDLGLDSAGRAYFTMKLVKGSTLKDVFELAAKGEQGWTRTRALGVLLRVCEAMSYAHAKGVVHRDLKPSNIMVGRFGEVYVMDWGVARIRSRRDGRDLRPRPPVPRTGPTGEIELASPVVTMDGTVVGTPFFMSPEQARGGWVDERADVYAVGAMLYALAAGQPPYGEGSEESTPHEVLERVIQGPPPPIPHRKQVPPELEAICHKAMARAAEERYAGMTELADDLRAYLEGRVVSAHRTGALVELRKWTGRNRALASSLAAAIVILVAGLVASLVLANRAETQRGTAERERNKALRLSSLMTWDYVLEEELDELWPAHPENLEAYALWLERAEQFRAQYPEDIAAEVSTLRERALPRGEEQRARERRTHPRFAELRRLERELAAVRAAKAVREGRAEPHDFPLEQALLPAAVSELNDVAWALVDPEREVFGREAEGLAMAQLAAEYATPAEADYVADTLAWALLANGLDEQALAESATAVELARSQRREELEASAVQLGAAIEAARSGATLAAHEGRHAALDAEVSRRRSWSFAGPDDQWWHDVLTRFVATFESLFDPEVGVVSGISAEHGWGVVRRRAWAERVEELTVTGPDAAQRWSRASASIADERASPAYRGLQVEPQLGLLPIGRDPASGLFEFAHLQTGEAPRRDGEGGLILSEETGLVFVLIPGGAFEMGAQQRSPDRPNFDPQARPSEGPVHRVRIRPFFLSKYELTQAQWLRFTGSNPSYYPPEEAGLGTTLLHPIERVSWFDADRVCRRLGLTLPSEAQWEYAARGGTDTTWWTGDSRDSLEGSVNLADRAARRIRAPWAEIDDWPELDDGHPVHAPVDSYRPNPFGLHNVHGNVWEWCRDAYEPGFATGIHETDPVHEPRGDENRVSRGGSFRSRSISARSAFRQNDAPDSAQSEMGLRPARTLDPR